ncbi:endothelial cell-specific chemotaxis regulator isoform X1 [Elephas maximus indicus]|uniref:endothelial cell-specific chemotaxis regulator isoform X1 n=1 Tax=Elephas maximus indicus TaxID=99487 RepID=UPI0021161BEC|nr:endothelial cell-specific chemotaxis regulator isoform X1 [Elephas maximus indicus]
MGTIGATQLCWAILGFLLLQGHNSQPTTTQTRSPQGDFSSLSLTLKSTSSNTGDVPHSEPNRTSPLSSTGTPAPPKKASQVLIVTHERTTPGSSTMDGHSSSSLGLPRSQPQKHTSVLGAPHSSRSSGSPSGDTFYNITPKSTAMSLRTGEYLTILPSPTSESVLTVAAFGVISFIVILVVVVIVLVSVVSLRFKCRKNKESEDPQKPGSSGISESCSTANGEKDSITLISMKNINTNNSKRWSSAEKVL